PSSTHPAPLPSSPPPHPPPPRRPPPLVAVAGPPAPAALPYAPPAGTVLNAGGAQTLTVTAAATPNYDAATKSVTIDVQRATPVIDRKSTRLNSSHGSIS